MTLRLSTLLAIALLAGLSAGVLRLERSQSPADEASELKDPWTKMTGPRKPWIPVGRMDTNVVRESSGVVASRRYPGVLWTHSDSLNEPKLYAVDETGKTLSAVPIAALNRDWEDLAIDDNGHLYIGDIGNNFGWFEHGKVYKIDEPNPHDPPHAPIQPLDVLTFDYPQDRFDAEGLFVHADVVYVVSRRDRGKTRVYRLDSVGGGRYTPTRIAALGPDGASGASLSRDGTRLAICTSRVVWVYPVKPDMTPVEGEKPHLVRHPSDRIEGCAFADEDLILTNEAGKIFRLTAADIRDQTIFVPP